MVELLDPLKGIKSVSELAASMVSSLVATKVDSLKVDLLACSKDTTLVVL